MYPRRWNPFVFALCKRRSPISCAMRVPRTFGWNCNARRNKSTSASVMMALALRCKRHKKRGKVWRESRSLGDARAHAVSRGASWRSSPCEASGPRFGRAFHCPAGGDGVATKAAQRKAQCEMNSILCGDEQPHSESAGCSASAHRVGNECGRLCIPGAVSEINKGISP